ncbi:hypothetical protein Tco_0960114 [Tanacetum coccineum]
MNKAQFVFVWGKDGGEVAGGDEVVAAIMVAAVGGNDDDDGVAWWWLGDGDGATVGDGWGDDGAARGMAMGGDEMVDVGGR